MNHFLTVNEGGTIGLRAKPKDQWQRVLFWPWKGLWGHCHSGGPPQPPLPGTQSVKVGGQGRTSFSTSSSVFFVCLGGLAELPTHQSAQPPFLHLIGTYFLQLLLDKCYGRGVTKISRCLTTTTKGRRSPAQRRGTRSCWSKSSHLRLHRRLLRKR